MNPLRTISELLSLDSERIARKRRLSATAPTASRSLRRPPRNRRRASRLRRPRQYDKRRPNWKGSVYRCTAPVYHKPFITLLSRRAAEERVNKLLQQAMSRTDAKGCGLPIARKHAMNFERRLIFPAVLFLCNIASAIACFAGGDWKRGLYWTASSVCIASISA